VPVAFAVLAAVLALGDWWAVWTERHPVRWVTKPGTLAALVGVAATMDVADSQVRAWLVVGLVLSLLGDVFLLMDERWFVAGLGSFLLAHIAYVVALQLAPTSVPWTLVGLAVVVVSVALVGRRVVSAVAGGDHRAMVGPVTAYLLVISAMVVSAFGTGSARAVGGASLFYASDATLAWNRFVEQRRHGHIAVMVTYHVGQAGLVWWLR
jgi:uncharacterized membrane protein YhhN